MQDCYFKIYQVSAEASGDSSRTSVCLKSVQEEGLAQSTTRNRTMQSVLVFIAQCDVRSKLGPTTTDQCGASDTTSHR